MNLTVRCDFRKAILAAALQPDEQPVGGSASMHGARGQQIWKEIWSCLGSVSLKTHYSSRSPCTTHSADMVCLLKLFFLLKLTGENRNVAADEGFLLNKTKQKSCIFVILLQ